MKDSMTETTGKIAIVGMAGRFPRCPDVAAFWSALVGGEVPLEDFSRDELDGVPPGIAEHPDFVAQGFCLEGIDLFDAQFFGYSAAEASRLDPQQRIFLETCWHAMEDAGQAPGDRPDRRTGVYAAANFDTYGAERPSGASLADPETYLRGVLAGDKDYLAARVAHRLDLHGPAISMQTACSSSLVAAATAVTDLLTCGCDLAIAGGVGIRSRQKVGYLRREEGALAAPGGCRPFDAAASGMIDGSGAAAVVLRRLEDALADRDRIYAVISGAGLSNDGARKSGFTAPSAAGQAQAIAMALDMAGIGGDQIGFVETHGTGTPIGDPIEYAALVEALGARPGARRLLGALKANFGHMSAAAGVAGLIKAALALHHGLVPPHPRFDRPNLRCGIEPAGFHVNTTPEAWPRGSAPRHAGVSSFGIGGTNAHLVLEEAPEAPSASATDNALRLYPVSARTPGAVADHAARLAACGETDGPSMARMLCRRAALPVRRCVGARSGADAAGALATAPSLQAPADPRPVFAFSGIGRAAPSTGRGLFAALPAFRAAIAEIDDLAMDLAGIRIAPFFHSGGPLESRDPGALMLAHFALQTGLASAYREAGAAPEAMIGHSLGEYAAACLAGVFTLPQAVRIVAERAALLAETAPGAMCVVPAETGEGIAAAGRGICIAGWTTPGHVTLAGPRDEMETLRQELRARKVPAVPLAAARAGHSALLDPVLPRFRAVFDGMTLGQPDLPFISNLTGDWADPQEVARPEYWVRQLREPVRFAQGAARLAEWGATSYLDIGPGGGLAPLLTRHPDLQPETVISALPDHNAAQDEETGFHESLARLWCLGAAEKAPRARLGGAAEVQPASLPGYAFQRQSYWLPPSAVADATDELPLLPFEDWLHQPQWAQYRPLPVETPRPHAIRAAPGDTLAAALAQALPAQLVTGDMDAGSLADHTAIWDLRTLRRTAGPPELDAALAAREDLAGLIRALARTGKPLRLIVPTQGLARVTGGEPLAPEYALLQGIVLSAAHENPRLSCETVDLDPEDDPLSALCDLGAAAPAETPMDALLAVRMGQLWRQELRPVPGRPFPAALAPKGRFVLAGGDGGIARTLAEALAEASPGAHLALIVRPHPDRAAERAAFAGNLQNRFGASLSWHAADLADAAATEAALRAAANAACGAADRAEDEAQDGRAHGIDGIVLAAGVAGGGLIEAELPEGAQSNTGPKAGLLAAVEKVFAGTPLGFLAMCSSVGASFGAAGQADNMGANRVFDLYAQSDRLPLCRRKIAIGWDYWRDTGMIRILGPRHKALTGEEIRHGMTAKEGAAWFLRCLGAPLPVPVISTLPTDWIRTALARRLGEAMAVYERAAPAAGAQARAPRPPLGTPFAAPDGALETLLARVWAETLGFEEIGRGDSFLELGGDSLAALPMLARIRDALDCELPVSALYRSLSVAGCAAHLRAADPGDIELRARLYLHVQTLDEDALAGALAADASAPAQREPRR
ncbi:beta-ketoacyl synthase [Rhodovulum sulfidophilum]|uniref:Beta-ketoacyl synthase n=1 Tax=Rhodovulum sulfidophilum TaxID=35806 RepID=A0A0D6AZ77_RHOSU|nr:beta-ketoacyl synthase [Rhodovulum sulfidophilum]